MKVRLKLLSFTLIIALFTSLLSGCKKQESSTLTKVRLNEVVRSIFYAPMYVALNQGFFKEEGLDIELSTGQGADATYANRQVKNSNN